MVVGRGGFGENPNAEQFRGAFRQIIVDQLLTKCVESNCKEDLDRILLDLTSISGPKKKREQVRSVPATPKLNLDENVSVSDVVNTVEGLAFENMAVYVAGYVLKKMQINCADCCKHYTLSSLPSRHKSYAFLRNKRYSEHCNLVYPTMKFVTFISELELVYTSVFPKISHAEKLLCSLADCVTENIDRVLSCKLDDCKERVLYAVKLFFKVRVYSSLKRTNSENKEAKGKRNKKMMKLMNI